MFRRRLAALNVVRNREIVLCLGAILLTGCVNRKPLIALPESQRNPIHFVNKSHGREINSHSSVVGARNAEDIAVYSGAIGSLVTTAVNEAVESANKNWVLSVIRSSENAEPLILEQAVINALEQTQPASIDQNAPRTLELLITRLGIAEIQRGWFAPFATVTLALTDENGEEIWLARAQSASSKPHRKDDLVKNPKLYRTAFQEVAVDIARQLIIGPIRDIPNL